MQKAKTASAQRGYEQAQVYAVKHVVAWLALMKKSKAGALSYDGDHHGCRCN